jgi:hypothetical protein
MDLYVALVTPCSYTAALCLCSLNLQRLQMMQQMGVDLAEAAAQPSPKKRPKTNPRERGSKEPFVGLLIT